MAYGQDGPPALFFFLHGGFAIAIVTVFNVGAMERQRNPPAAGTAGKVIGSR
jgi:hypothetical protein